jgi:biotin transport system substrate-specific component
MIMERDKAWSATMPSFSPAATVTSEPAAKTSVLSRMVFILGFAVATAAGARLEIPHEPIPYTLQTLVVLLAGAFLGWRDGAISQMLYLLAGIAGLPVFAGGHVGLATLVGPSGGYLGAFPLAAMLVGYLISSRRGLPWIVLSMTAGLFLIFTLGTLHLHAWYIHDLATAFTTGFLIFSWWDMLKLGAASMIYFEFTKRGTR